MNPIGKVRVILWIRQCPTCASGPGEPCRTQHAQVEMGAPHRDRPLLVVWKPSRMVTPPLIE